MTNGSGPSPPGTVVPQIGEEALYLKTLQELIQLRNDFARSKWTRRLAGAPSGQQTAFAELRIRVQDRVRDLTNAQLEQIASDLRANEANLSQGIQETKEARLRFETIGKAFKAFSGFLGAVETVLKIAAGAVSPV